MIEILTFLVGAAIVMFCVTICGMVIVGALNALVALISGVMQAFGVVMPVKRSGRHAAGAPPKLQPEEGGDFKGWEPSEVDASTGEVKSFVWKGKAKEE